MVVGSGAFLYERDTSWGRRDGGVPAFGVAQGVACDSKDRVYVFNRSPRAEMIVFDASGRLLTTWGLGQFFHPHGVWINERDEILITDRDHHVVSRWTTDGTLLRTIGTPGRAGAPGAPFNQPTKAIETSDGEIYVSDGYGQRRTHRFDKGGGLIRSWGEEGTGPSQFALPHDVVVDQRNRVLVCDRENARVQIFDRSGDFTGEWAGLKNPMQIFVPTRGQGGRSDVLYMCESLNRVSILSLDGAILASFDYASVAPRKANAPHSIWVDSHGAIYIGEVTGEDGLQKFVRQ